ncbi:hypothetical protein SISNIDRAFT_490406 [Sistotremastrum niveocremeum HHB9708]|uniref:Uncharacterized protein n=1 Tax=Sistotremastrum niveocremeum HHB9708 TaxID=1314777 RepID=A0A164P0B6_9AGAM|nr:hypothetical protein SISNIDRAFT_490406 [Sistotremastrum niveocremeum HHB9708]
MSLRTDYISEHFTPTWENCSDILHLLSLPFDKFIAQCLCINSHNVRLGNHYAIFNNSTVHCYNLLRADKSDDVTRILSHVDLFSAVRSFVLADRYVWGYERVLELIIGDRTSDVLRLLNECLSTSRVNPRCGSSVFLVAARSLSHLPSDVDLSLIISHIAWYPSRWEWRDASNMLITHLAQCDISALSKRSAVYKFLQHCVDREFRDTRGCRFDTSEETRHAAQTLLDQHRALFIPLPPPSPQSASINLTEDTSESSEDDWFRHRANSDQSEDGLAPSPGPLDPDPDNPSERQIYPLDPLPFYPNCLTASEDHELIDMTMPPVPPGSGSLPSSSFSRVMTYLSRPARAVYNWLRSLRNPQDR